MAVTVADIQARQEFANADAQLIAQCIADADALVNSTAYGDATDRAVKYKAMHLIAMSPFGEALRFAKPDAAGCTSTYESVFRGISTRSNLARGPMVVV